MTWDWEWYASTSTFNFGGVTQGQLEIIHSDGRGVDSPAFKANIQRWWR